MTKVEQVIQLARKYIKQGWCKGFFAKDKYGKDCSITSARGCSWCLNGAVYRATWALGFNWGIGTKVLKIVEANIKEDMPNEAPITHTIYNDKVAVTATDILNVLELRGT